MSGLFGTAAATSAASTQGEIKNDVALSTPPSDGISDLKFAPTQDLLAVSSWDNKVYIYQVNPSNGQSEGKAMIEHQGPALSCCWTKVSTVLRKGANLQMES
jgi:mRNA export factor